MSETTAIDIKELTKSFAIGSGETLRAVDGVDLAIADGSVVALTGTSGSGKSTLLHLIGAIEVADTGTITVAGTSLEGLNRKALAGYRRTVGFVFQRFNLLPALTAIDNVMVPVLPYPTDYDKAERARELLAAVGLEGRERDLPSKLSGGQQQRVAIARALINRPRLLLADEPTGNLDSTTGTTILDLLLSLRAEHDMTMLIATHDPQVAARCSRTITLMDGRIVEDQSAQQKREDRNQ
jgi:putative ABC transport system ATP-binding protein